YNSWEGKLSSTLVHKEVSVWYQALLDAPDSMALFLKKKWGEVFPNLDLVHIWERSSSMRWSVTRSVALKKNQLFTMHRAYWSPRRLSAVGNLEKKCLRCGEPNVDDVHMFWSCPYLAPFWSGIKGFLKQFISIDIEATPPMVFFGVLSNSTWERKLSRLCKGILFLLILLARRQICLKWV
ncbi:hypothetical protein NDU88_002891, partial [Pleurodeles waltl]